MGKLVYGTAVEVIFDDRPLAHLQLVVGAKLRRGESFFLSWQEQTDAAGGRSTIWCSPAIPLIFRYNGGRMPEINRAWLDILIASSNSAQGLLLSAEPTGPGDGAEHGR